MPISKIETIGYVAVRKDNDGKEYMDFNTLDMKVFETVKKSDRQGGLDKVIKIIQVKLEEVKVVFENDA